MKAKILYGKYNNKGYTLLYLGESNGTIHGLKSDLIPADDAKKIAVRASSLNAGALRGWIREKMPGIYKVAYRTIPSKGFKVMREYDLNAG